VKKESAAHSHSSDSEERNIVSQKSVKVDQPKKANNTLEKKKKGVTLTIKHLIRSNMEDLNQRRQHPILFQEQTKKKTSRKKTITYREIS